MKALVWSSFVSFYARIVAQLMPGGSPKLRSITIINWHRRFRTKKPSRIAEKITMMEYKRHDFEVFLEPS